MINLLAILWITDPALGSLLVGNTCLVQAHTSLDQATLGRWTRFWRKMAFPHDMEPRRYPGGV